MSVSILPKNMSIKLVTLIVHQFKKKIMVICPFVRYNYWHHGHLYMSKKNKCNIEILEGLLHFDCIQDSWPAFAQIALVITCQLFLEEATRQRNVLNIFRFRW